MEFKKIIPEGGLIPKGYGVAWRANNSMMVICYPIFINLLVRAYLDLYYWIIHGCWKSKWESELLTIRLREAMKFREDYKERLLVLAHLEKIDAKK